MWNDWWVTGGGEHVLPPSQYRIPQIFYISRGEFYIKRFRLWQLAARYNCVPNDSLIKPLLLNTRPLFTCFLFLLNLYLEKISKDTFLLM